MSDDYDNFIARKLRAVPPEGMSNPPAPSTLLFPWQRECVTWGLQRGRAAFFEDCGLGKTPQQLDWARIVCEVTGGRVLIFAPLGVTGQTIREGAKFGVHVTYVRDSSELPAHGVVITNYERIDKFNPLDFAGVVLDESSILKAYSGATKRALIAFTNEVRYRLFCTATPAPNDTLELGNHSEGLGVLTSHEMIARWFLPETDSKAGTYRLKGHAVEPYWDWVTSWARCVGRPSDLGAYSDEGYVLPEIDRVTHVIGVDVTESRGADRDGQASLFRMPTLSSTSMHKEKRLTVEARARKVADIVTAQRDEPWIIWCDTDYEDDAIRAVLPEVVSVRGSDSAEDKEAKLLGFSSGSIKWLMTKPRIGGFGMNWQHCARSVRVGPTFSFEQSYQEERRIWRFGQKRPVQSHIIMAATEVDVYHVAQRKAREHEAMGREMFAAARRALERSDDRAVTYNPRHIGRLPSWLQEGIGA